MYDIGYVVFMILVFAGLGWGFLADARIRRRKRAEVARIGALTPEAMRVQFAALEQRYDDLLSTLAGTQGDLEDARRRLQTALATLDDPAFVPLDHSSRELRTEIKAALSGVGWVQSATGESLAKTWPDGDLGAVRTVVREYAPEDPNARDDWFS